MPGEVRYDDYVWNLSEEGGVFYYKIRALESASSRFQDQSESNTIKITKEPTSYIPNAFAPDGVNEVNQIFKPVCVYVDADSYDFKIYNRWGELLFQTKDVNEGWDGNFRNKPAPQGVYTYVITYKLDEKKNVVKRGTVLLMR
jgi:gliding motility-associated-like protein